MARPLRLDFAGAVWHLTSRGNAGDDIFYNDEDRLDFLELLGEAKRRFNWLIFTYILLTNHFHLVIETPEATLSRGMQWLLGTYVNRFNRRHKRSGHLFQGRFKGILIEKETQLLNVLRYVALNPVRAHMATLPEEYRWGSYRAIAGLEPSPAWLSTDAVLETFAPDPERARELYRLFVNDLVNGSRCIWKDLVEGIYLGSEEWRARIQRRIDAAPRSDEHPKRQRYVARPKMAQIVPVVATVFEIPVHEVRKKHGGPARRVGMAGMLRRDADEARDCSRFTDQQSRKDLPPDQGR
jgi:putative transposase